WSRVTAAAGILHRSAVGSAPRVRTRHAPSVTPVECPLQVLMTAKRMAPPLRMSKHTTSLFGQGSHRAPGRDMPPMCSLAGDGSNRPAGDGRYGLDQITGLRIPIEGLRHLSDSPGELRSGLRDSPGDLRQRLLCHGSDRSGRNREKLAGSHPDQRQKMLCGFVLRLRLECQFTQMFHHGVRVNFADGIELVFRFCFKGAFAFVLILRLSKEIADYVPNGAQPAFSFEARLILILVFHFAFSRVLIFEFMLQDFTLGLISHDVSSSNVDCRRAFPWNQFSF